MDMPSMIMGAAIASVAWVACWPWTKLRKLQALEAERTGPDTAGSPQ
ncbi:hypothetical protein [Curtobacterium sp. 9128]|nr:hypothetical protein [Curtobacterium sp. 9128]